MAAGLKAQPSQDLSQSSTTPELDRTSQPRSIGLTPPYEHFEKFFNHWQNSTSDDSLSLYAFRRFRTSQLLNLRFLEDEIATLNSKIFQAGLKLRAPIDGQDYLGLKNARIDPNACGANEIITASNVQKLRRLLKEYNEALIAFNSIMAMEICSMTDSHMISNQQSRLNYQEAYTTRLVRVDLPPGSSRDPLRSKLIQWFWALRFYRTYIKPHPQVTDDRRPIGPLEANQRITDQNTTEIADIVARFLVALLAGIFLVVPLVILTFQTSPRAHLLTVSLCIVVFSFLLSLGTKASNQETMVASAGYAAVLVVFVASSPSPRPT